MSDRRLPSLRSESWCTNTTGKRQPSSRNSPTRISSTTDSRYYLGDSFDMSTKIPSEFHEYTGRDFPLEIPSPLDEHVAFGGSKGVRTFPSQKPTSRKEVQILSRVYDVMVCMAQSSNENESTMFERQMQICDSVLHEIARQVYVQCNERGVLLRNVVNRWHSLWKQQLREKEDALFAQDERIAEMELMIAQLNAEKEYEKRKTHEELVKLDKSRFGVDETAYTTFLGNLQKYHIHLELISEKTKAWSRIRQRFNTEQRQWKVKEDVLKQELGSTAAELVDAKELIQRLEESNTKLAQEITDLRSEFMMLRRAAMRIAAAGADADIDSDLRNLRKALKQLRQSSTNLYVTNASEVNLVEQYDGKLDEELHAQQSGLVERSSEMLPPDLEEDHIARHSPVKIRKEKPLKAINEEDSRPSPVGRKIADLLSKSSSERNLARSSSRKQL